MGLSDMGEKYKDVTDFCNSSVQFGSSTKEAQTYSNIEKQKVEYTQIADFLGRNSGPLLEKTLKYITRLSLPVVR
jgi:hypothetical protein